MWSEQKSRQQQKTKRKPIIASAIASRPLIIQMNETLSTKSEKRRHTRNSVKFHERMNEKQT